MSILRPLPGYDMQRRGYPLAPLAEAWRRYLPPLLLDRKAVTAVTPVTRKVGDTREVLDEYFEWVLVDDNGKPVTDVTGVTGFEPKRDGQETAVKAETAGVAPEQETGTVLDFARVNELAGWVRMQIMADDQIRKDLREMLAKEIQASALDAEVDRVMKAANTPNFVEVLSRPIDDWSPFDVKPKNRG